MKHAEILKSMLLLLSLAIGSTVLFSGCGPSAPKLTSADMKAFEAASPELKQTWARAHAAAGTNDYALAILTLRSLIPQNLSVDQVEAVQNAIRTYNVKLVNAASRGDAAAQKGLEDLRSAGRPARSPQ